MVLFSLVISLSSSDNWLDRHYARSGKWMRATMFWAGYRVRPEDRAAVMERIIREATYVSEKQIYSYCKARAGNSGLKMVNEEEFIVLLDPCRAQGYALLLADAILLLAHAFAQEAQQAMREGSNPERTMADRWTLVYEELLQQLPDRFKPHLDPVPYVSRAQQRFQTWLKREELLAADVVSQSAGTIYDNLPIRSQVRQYDFPMFQNTLMIALANFRQLSLRIFTKRQIALLLEPYK